MQRIATSHYLLVLASVGALTLPAQAQGFLTQVGWNDNVFPYGTNASQVQRGLAAIALLEDGSILTVGPNGEDLISDTPSGSGFIQIASTNRHALALSGNGELVSWGNDWSGQVTATPAGQGFVAISAGAWHSLAIAADGSLNSWGRDNFGQVSNTPSGSDFAQISAGSTHSCALRIDGSIVTWGNDTNGVVSNSPSGNDFVQVISYANSSSALRVDGSIAAWGSDLSAYVSDAPTGTGFTKLMGARMAVRPDGTLQGWGSSDMPPPGKGFIDMVGEPHLAIYILSKDSGTAFCFGDGSGSTCPCDVEGLAGSGCPHHPFSGGGANLIGYGDTSISQDSFGLAARDLPWGTVGVVLRSANRANDGLGIPLADGLLCAVGQSQRSQVGSAGSTPHLTFTHFNGQPFGQSTFGPGVPTNYQLWYRSPATSCSGLNSNFSNAWEVIWTL